MSYVEKNLNPGEKIIAEPKRSPLFLIGKSLGAILWVGFTIGLSFINDEPMFRYLALLAVISFAFQVIKFIRNKLTLTSNRVIFRKGVFSTKSVDMLYEQIETVKITQGLLGKIFRYSTIEVSTGGTESESIEAVVNGDKFKNTIMDQVNVRKQAAAEEQARLQAQAMREAFAAMQQSNSNPNT